MNATSGVTIKPAATQLSSYITNRHDLIKDINQLLKASVDPSLSGKCKEIFQSSFTDYINSTSAPTTIQGQSNSFVNLVCSSYSAHHHLILRPDDLWTCILTQFNAFVNANAEDLRHLFVAHDGKKRLEVEAAGTRYTVDFGQMAEQMGHLIQENIVDEELRQWFMPDFSTTELNDQIVASVIMMATLKEYFSYEFALRCGIPAVTLRGTRDDWIRLHEKVDKLTAYGEQTTAWHTILKPVLGMFIESFDNPTSDKVKDFWNRVCHYSGGGSGPTYLSGWITAFCFFSDKGKPLDKKWNVRQVGSENTKENWLSPPIFESLGVYFHAVDTSKIPGGYAEVDVDLNDNGQHFDTKMVAGLMTVKIMGTGIEETQDHRNSKIEEMEAWDESHPQYYAKKWRLEGLQKDPLHDGNNDMVQPLSGWYIFEAGKNTDQTDLF